MKITYKANYYGSSELLSIYLIENIGPFCNETLVTYTIMSLLSLGFFPFYYSIMVWLSGAILAFVLGTQRIKKSEGRGFIALNCLVGQLKDGDILSFESKTYMIISHDKAKKEYLALEFEGNKNIKISYI